MNVTLLMKFNHSLLICEIKNSFRPLKSHEFLSIFIFLEEEWKVHRRIVSPTINQTSVGTHLPIFNANIRESVSNLPTIGGFFDILPSIAKCKMTMFTEAALGTELPSDVKQRYLRQFIAYVWNNVNNRFRKRNKNVHRCILNAAALV